MCRVCQWVWALSVSLWLVCPALADQGTPTFRAGVHLVLVPVVVRDRNGNSIGAFTKEDFRVLDEGKEQTITDFFIEKSGTGAEDTAGPHVSRKEAVPTPARSYVAYLLDDLNLKFGELVAAKEAVFKCVAASLPSVGTRIAILSTSGRLTLDFTDNLAAIKAALLSLVPHPVAGIGSSDCPRMPYTLAMAIVMQDSEAFHSAMQEAMACSSHSDPLALREMVIVRARQIVSSARSNGLATLAGIRHAVTRVSAAPGSRTIVLVSPGFVIPDSNYELMTIVDRAIRARVIIGALDARGVRITGKAADISLQVTASVRPDRMDTISELATDAEQAAILTELTSGSGGLFIRGRNDLAPALTRLAGRPGHVYVLGFSPKDLRQDGDYHRLTVKLQQRPRGSTLIARRGYFATKSDQGK